MITTEYGSWSNYGTGVVSIRDTVTAFIQGGGQPWVDEMTTNGAFDRVVDDFRDAINAQLPDGFTLAGDTFYGPADIGFLRPDAARTMIRLAIEHVDLGEIVARHDVDNTVDNTADSTPGATTTETNSDAVSRGIAYAENYDDVYGLTFPGRHPAAGDSRDVT